MTPPDAKKKGGGMPPQDLTRLAQRDIGKVARLFRDSGFRYRVFDSETGEHQVVDPVRPLPPMDHVPPVWPPPLSDESPHPSSPPLPARQEATPPASVAPRPRPEPEESPAARRAEAKTDEIFRAAALGQVAPAAARRTQPSAPAPSPQREPSPPPQEEEAKMSSSRTQASSSAARQVGRLVAIAGSQGAKSAPAAGAAESRPEARLFRAGGPTVAAVFDRLMQPPAPPPRREPTSTAAVLRSLVEPRATQKK